MTRYARLAPLAVIAWLGACANPLALAPGTPQAEVTRTFGRPDDTHALAEGARRLEYRLGPLQQTKYMVDLDREGRVTAVAQVHDFDRFARLRIGVDTAADVRREFGEPRQVQRYAVSGLVAWLYPYREAGVFNSEMAVYFDGQGHVVKVESGPDPRFLGGRNGKDD